MLITVRALAHLRSTKTADIQGVDLTMELLENMITSSSN